MSGIDPRLNAIKITRNGMPAGTVKSIELTGTGAQVDPTSKKLILPDSVNFSGTNNDIDLTQKGNIILGPNGELLGTNPDGTQHVIGAVKSYEQGDGSTLTQTEIGSVGNHLNLNSLDKPSVDLPGGVKKHLAYDDPATETTPGTVMLATLNNVRDMAGTGALIADNIPDFWIRRSAPINLFLETDVRKIAGTRYTWVSSSRGNLEGSPLYELYDITTATYSYIFVTNIYNSTAAISAIQEAYAMVTNSPNHPTSFRKFQRVAMSNTSNVVVWGKWREMPSAAYYDGNLDIIIDPENGDDTTGRGTTAAPYKTLLAAYNAASKLVTGYLRFRLMDGTFELAASVSIPNAHCVRGIAIEAFDAANKPIITNAEGVLTGAYDKLIGMGIINSFVRFQNIVFEAKESGSPGYGALHLANTGTLVQMATCDFKNFKRNTALYCEANANLVLNACTFENCATPVVGYRSNKLFMTNCTMTDCTGSVRSTSGKLEFTDGGGNTYINTPEPLMPETMLKITDSTFIAINGATTLPSGGTWVWQLTTGGVSTSGISAGGTSIGAAGATGFARRIQ